MDGQSAPTGLPASGSRIWRVAVFGAAIVLALGYLVELIGQMRGVPSHQIGLNFLRLDEEASLPPLFSSLLMLTIAVLAFRTGRDDRLAAPRTSLGWTLLSVGFVYLALDEFLALHEVFSRMPQVPNYGGVLRQKWLLVGIPLVAVIGLLFIPFLLRIRRQTALRLIVAGTVYLSGAVGAELISGWIIETAGKESALYALETMAEETLEIVGLLLGLRAILLHRAVMPSAADAPATN